MSIRIAYTTDDINKTVTIDYNKTLQLFLTEKEQHPFSAERIIQMLNGWAAIGKVDITFVGRLHIAGDGAHCVLTQQALRTLAFLYWQHSDWCIEYPSVAKILSRGASQ